MVRIKKSIVQATAFLLSIVYLAGFWLLQTTVVETKQGCGDWLRDLRKDTCRRSVLSVDGPTTRLMNRERRSGAPDYGGLRYKSLANSSIFQRDISIKDAHFYEIQRKKQLRRIDEPDMDIRFYRNDELEYPRECIPPSWVWSLFPNCNTFHEITMERLDSQLPNTEIRFLGRGNFRTSFRMTSPQDQVVLKNTLLSTDLDYRENNYKQVHTEARIMEQLSASRHIVDSYGHCGTSVLVEPLPVDLTYRIVPKLQGQKRGRFIGFEPIQTDKVQPINNLTVYEKLDIAITMAESIAVLHGFSGGVIINGDIHPDQYLVSESGKIKLGKS